MNTERQYISDMITDSKVFRPHCLNLITAGCGAGKSYFVAKHLPKLFPDIRPCDILFVTSRAITVDQQAREYQDGVVKFSADEEAVVDHWVSGSDDVSQVERPDRLRLMTFDKLIELITQHNDPDRSVLEGIRVVVVDECQALVSDTFIQGITSVVLWLKMAMRFTDTIFVGLTATPNILLASANRHGFPINMVLDEPIVTYKANHLWIVDEADLVYMLTDGTLPGKTIVMGDSRGKMVRMAADVPNSAVLVSQHSKFFTQHMVEVRKSIVEQGTLPDKLSYTGQPVDVLFATTTMREGVTLRPESEVRNVVTFIPDEMHVTQFLGRCRFDVENLVVVYSKSAVGYTSDIPYLAQERHNYMDFVFFKDDRWFNSISHLVRGGLSDVRRYRHKQGLPGFYDYIDTRWAVDDEDDVPNEKCIRKENQAEIVEQANKQDVFNETKQSVCYSSIKRILNDSKKMRVIDKRIRNKGERYRCDIIVRIHDDGATEE